MTDPRTAARLGPLKPDADRLLVLHVVTDSVSVRGLLRRQLAFLAAKGVSCAVASSDGPGLSETAKETDALAYPVLLSRRISPLKDLVALFQLCRAIKSCRPTVVSAGTPKAALLGLVAARLCNVPSRIYMLRGLRLETTRGLVSRVLSLSERITSACATTVIPVSRSLASEYIRRRLCDRAKVRLIGKGSSQGVDYNYFSQSNVIDEARRSLRQQYRIPSDAFVVGFIGRLTTDKGVVELSEAFKNFAASVEGSILVIVGRNDNIQGNALVASALSELKQHMSVRLVGYQKDPRPFFALFDVLAFPSHREGFPNVVLEAAAMEVPTVAYRATGTVDAVADGETGVLVDRLDVTSFSNALIAYAKDDALRRKHGVNARLRAVESFNPEGIFEALLQVYRSNPDLPESDYE